MTNEYYDEFDEMEPIEAYCVRCRETIEVENPRPVWTRKGQPATRGECPMCGGIVFRLGKTDYHREKDRPEAVVVGESDKRARAKLARDTVYINFASSDEEFAQQLAADLEKSGLAVWLHDNNAADVAWSGGVHPALKECARMLVVLSESAVADVPMLDVIRYFKSTRKPIVVAQIQNVELPDDVRRSARYDMGQDYKRNLRQIVGALTS